MARKRKKKATKAPRDLSRPEKRILSKQLLYTWHMFAWASGKAHTDIPAQGAPAQLRALYGTSMAVFMRKLVAFYFPSPRAHLDEVHAARFIKGWKPAIPPALTEATDYVSKYIVHITESHLECEDKMPVPPGGKWLAALAPIHNDWLRAVDPEDLHSTWREGNMRCFRILAEPKGIRADGRSDYEPVLITWEFSTLAGIIVPDPPKFLAALVKRKSTLVLPGKT